MSHKELRGGQTDRYRNVMLTAIAGFLALIVVQGTPIAADASAQRGGPNQGLVNPADQRREMISLLQQMSSRLDAIDQTLKNATFDVNVLDMPEIALESD